MKESPLRILIVDSSETQRAIIERVLNLSECFHVAPVTSFSQLLAYTQYALRPIDIVLISSRVAIDSGVDVYSFCAANVNIKHFVIYNAAGFDALALEMSSSKVKAVLPGTLDAQALRALLAMIQLGQVSHPNFPPSHCVSDK